MRKPKELPPLPSPTEAITYRLNDLPRVAGISRSAAYSLVKQGRLKLVKVGASSLITAESLRQLLSEAA